MTVQEFKDKLVEAVSVPVYHLMAAPDDECPVLCWQELETTAATGTIRRWRPQRCVSWTITPQRNTTTFRAHTTGAVRHGRKLSV